MKAANEIINLSTTGLLLLMLTPLISLRSQEIKRTDYPLPRLESEEPSTHSVSPAIERRSILIAWPREQASQKTTPTTTNSYVFPSSEQRLKRYLRDTVGPFAFLRVGAAAGFDQWLDSPEEWGQGAEGYGKRFASQFGTNAIRQTVTYGLAEAFRLDTGFEKSKRKGFLPRLSDALLQNVTSRTRSGKRVISAPILVGTYAGSIIPAETWYPSRYSYKDGLRSGSYSLAAGFGINVVREFLINW